MPHQCTNCKKVYEDGTDEVLNGCTSCGENTFQFVKRKTDTQDPLEETQDDSLIITDSSEDVAQKDARTKIISEQELRKYEENYEKTTPDSNSSPDLEKDIPSSPPIKVEDDISKVKESLNTQFEGIRVVNQGKYEINLTQLFERETQVISVQEDGKYVINVPETFKATEEQTN